MNRKRRDPRRASEHRVGLRRNGMPPIGGDGADLNSEMTLAALRTVARDVEQMAPEDRLEAITCSLGVLLEISNIITPQYEEIVAYMKAHDASDDHEEETLARIEGLIRWIHQLAPAEVVSLVAAAGSLLELIEIAGLDAPDEILEMFGQGDQPDE